MGVFLPPFDPGQPIPTPPALASLTGEGLLQSTAGPYQIGQGLDVVNNGFYPSIEVSSSGGSGTVTEIDTGTGLTGGPITTSGTISLDLSGAAAGDYYYATLSVDQYGRITAISDGGVASETALGIVQLANASEVAGGTNATKAVTSCSLQKKISDSVAISASTCIASSLAVKTAYDKANTAVAGATFTGKGALIAGVSSGTYAALPLGAEGQILTVCTAALDGTGLAWSTLSSSAIPCSLLTGPGSLIGSTAAATPVEIAAPTTSGLVLTSDTTCAAKFCWAPFAGISNQILTACGALIVGAAGGAPSEFPVGTNNQILIADSTNTNVGIRWIDNPAVVTGYFAAAGDILAGTGVCTYTKVSVGTDGYVLTANSGTAAGISWCALTPPIPASTLQNAGDLIVATGAGTATALPIGSTAGQVLKICDNGGTLGLNWADDSTGADIPLSTVTAAGDLIYATGNAAVANLAIGTNNYILSSNGTAPVWQENPAVLKSLICNTGDILIGSAALTPSILPVGTDGQVLKACAACSSGLTWVADDPGADIPCSLLTATGDIVVGSGAATPFALPVGTDGQVLKACSLCTTTAGLTWATDESGADIPCSTLVATGDIIYGSAANTPAALSIGTEGFVLKSVGGVPVWSADSTGADIPCSTLVAKGDIIVASAAATPSNLPVGADGLVLKANSAAPLGIEWGTDTSSPAASPTVQGILFGRTTNSGIDPTSVGYEASLCSTNISYSGRDNTSVGYQSLCKNMTGCRNTAVGNYSLTLLHSGCDNTAIGYNSLRELTNGFNNTAVGACVLSSITGGANNTAIGWNSMVATTTGSNNIAVGSCALCTNTSGGYNTAIGSNTLTANLDGNFNVALGDSALAANTSGSQNIALGACSLPANTTGARNTAVGVNALKVNTLGCQNNAIGTDALCKNTTGNFNLAVGECAMQGNVSGSNNVAIGDNALQNNFDSNGNLALGSCALCSATSSNNIAIGTNSGSSVTTGTCNIFLGGTGAGITTGTCNLVLGNTANFSSPSCANSILIGTNDTTYLDLNSTCSLAIGNSGYGTAGQYLQSNGSGAAPSWASPPGATPATPTVAGTLYGCTLSTGCLNTSLGYNAGNSTFHENVAIGYRAQCDAVGHVHSVAIGNCAMSGYGAVSYGIAIGTETMCGPSANLGNTAVGYRSLMGGTVGPGNFNTVLGYYAGECTQGTANTLIGASAGAALVTGNCNIIITAGNFNGGSHVPPGSCDQILFDTGNVWTQYAGNGGSWTGSSDIRLKENIADLELGLSAINQLRPRTFTWKATGIEDAGFIAQEVDEAFSSLDPNGRLKLVFKTNPDEWALAKGELMTVVVKALQELSAKVDALEAENSALLDRIVALESN